MLESLETLVFVQLLPEKKEDAKARGKVALMMRRGWGGPVLLCSACFPLVFGVDG